MMSLRSLLIAVVLVLPACMSLPGTGSLDHSAPRSATVDAEGAERVLVDAGAGDLEVVGQSDLNEVRAEGTARTSREEDLDEVQIEAQRNGSDVVITATFPDDSRGRTQLDFTVEVPQDLAADIEDSSGDLTIDNLAGPTLDVDDSSGDMTIQVDGSTTSIEDSSGDLELRDAGSTEISDSSGDIEVYDSSGTLTLNDSSGDILGRTVGGNVEVTEDSSGDIRLQEIAGNVHILEDSSGDIVVKQVAGDFTVDDDGSGDIRYEDVAGSITIPEDD